eukprot:scaffold123633_cov31-Tisochrysis_lutea.AAC.3
MAGAEPRVLVLPDRLVKHGQEHSEMVVWRTHRPMAQAHDFGHEGVAAAIGCTTRLCTTGRLAGSSCGRTTTGNSRPARARGRCPRPMRRTSVPSSDSEREAIQVACRNGRAFPRAGAQPSFRGGGNILRALERVVPRRQPPQLWEGATGCCAPCQRARVPCLLTQCGWSSPRAARGHPAYVRRQTSPAQRAPPAAQRH